FMRALTRDRRPGLAPAPWRERASRTRIEFVDAEGDPLPGLEVALTPAGDVLPGFSAGDARPRSRTADGSGAIEFSPLLSTHTRVAVAEALPLVGGDLVVDTARGVRMTLAVAGRAVLSVPMAEKFEAPATLTVKHVDADT